MTTAIFKGNKSRLLAIRPNNAMTISGISHVNTWIQSTAPVDAEFVESFAYSESKWEVISASNDDLLLQHRLNISRERLAELRQSNEFGALRCKRDQSNPPFYSMEVSIVVPDKQFNHIAYFLRSVTRSENTFYTMEFISMTIRQTAMDSGGRHSHSSRKVRRSIIQVHALALA